MKRRYLRAGNCWHIPEIRIQPALYILAAFWLTVLPGKWLAGALIAAFVHETGHLAALEICGIPVASLELGVLGARIHTGMMEDRQELFCALAGPLAGLSLCLLARWMPHTAIWAAVQSGFNLIPVYPFDGGRALAAAGRMMGNSRRN